MSTISPSRLAIGPSAGGYVIGVSCVQVPPVKAHVSCRPKGALASLPPNRMTVLFQVASAARARGGGADGEPNEVHVEPSHSQVSFNGPLTPVPPKRTILLPTVTMAWSCRAGGLTGGVSLVHVAPSHSHVSA